MQLAAGFMAAKHLFAASELGVFEALADSPADLNALAARTGLTRRAARISADAMVALGLLQAGDGTYRNSSVAAAFLALACASCRSWACRAEAWMPRICCAVFACTVCGATELAVACDPASAAASARLPWSPDAPGQAAVVAATRPATASAEPPLISAALVCLRGLR